MGHCSKYAVAIDIRTRNTRRSSRSPSDSEARLGCPFGFLSPHQFDEDVLTTKTLLMSVKMAFEMELDQVS